MVCLWYLNCREAGIMAPFTHPFFFNLASSEEANTMQALLLAVGLTCLSRYCNMSNW